MSNDIAAILEKLKLQPSELLESRSLEFKEYSTVNALHNAKDLAEELVALSNAGGGRIIVGVRDSSNVPPGAWDTQLVGFHQVDLLETEARIRGKIKPTVDLELTECEFESKSYLRIRIGPKSDTLVTTSSGKVYIRDGRSSRPMTPDEIASAVKSLSSYDWTADTVDGSVQELLSSADVEEAKKDFRERREIDGELDAQAFLEFKKVYRYRQFQIGW